MTPTVSEVRLCRKYKFLYENFVVATQGDVYLLMEEAEGKILALKFDSTVIKYGYPNDEVGHALMESGLGLYGLFEAQNSPWVEEIRNNNRSHPRDTDVLHRGKKHYIVRFKDVTFEAIARGFEEVELTKAELMLFVEGELGQLQ